MAKLVHSRDGTFIKEYPLKKGEFKIGRRPDCDIILDDTTVSGYHAKITVKPNEFMDGLLDVHVEDSGSTNGTLVNGRGVRRHLLKHGEVVRVGLHDLTLVDEHTRAFEETDFVLPEH
jgi:pSer/pThr/pTyr-binding forkhead associated (FHA) protein